MPYFVYILASGKNGTLYTGVTNDIARRMTEHGDGAAAGFTKRYGIRTLVFIEPHGRVRDAIAREKQIKNWRRDWKIALIEEDNPDWRDLYDELNA